jgi:tetratricopeptide (TPR) repeat protein
VSGETSVAASQHAAVALSGALAISSTGPTLVVGTLNIYVDGLPQAAPEVRHPFEEGRRLREAHEHDKAIVQFQAALAAADTDSRRGALHLQIGISHYLAGRLPQAEGSYMEALRLFEAAADQQGQAAAVGNLGLTYADRGDLERAEEHYQQALDIFRRIDNPLGQANQLGNLGLLAEQSGQPEEARRLLTEALALYERVGAGGEGPDAVRAALRRLEEAGGEEKPRRRPRKRKDQDPPPG